MPDPRYNDPLLDLTRNRELQSMIFELMLVLSEGKVKFDDIPSEEVKSQILDKLKRALTLENTKKKEVIEEIIENEKIRQEVLRVMKGMNLKLSEPTS